MNEKLPKDPFMLVGVINSRLRNSHDSLEELCATLDISQIALEAKLGAAGFIYSSETMSFH